MPIKGIVQPEFDEADVHAIRRLVEGNASPIEQKRAWQWIMTQACRVPSDTYAEVRAAGGDQSDITFAMGRRAAGLAILDMLSDKALERAKKASEPTSEPVNPMRKARDRRKTT